MPSLTSARSAGGAERQTVAQVREHASLQVVGPDKASFAQPRASLRGTRAGLTIDHCDGLRIELGVASGQLIERDMCGPRDDAAGDLGVGTHVDEHHCAVPLQRCETRTVDLVHSLLGLRATHMLAMIPAAGRFSAVLQSLENHVAIEKQLRQAHICGFEAGDQQLQEGRGELMATALCCRVERVRLDLDYCDLAER